MFMHTNNSSNLHVHFIIVNMVMPYMFDIYQPVAIPVISVLLPYYRSLGTHFLKLFLLHLFKFIYILHNYFMDLPDIIAIFMICFFFYFFFL